MSKRKGIIVPIPANIDAFEEHEIRKLNRKGIVTPVQQAMLDNVSFNGLVPKLDSVVSGKYVGSNNTHFLLDGGFKDFVQVPKKPTENTYFQTIQVGDMVDVNIDYLTESPFFVEGSIQSMFERRAKHMLLALEEKGETLLGTVTEYVGGGYTVELTVNGVTFKAFMPTILADVNKIIDTNSLIGKTFEVKIDKENNDDYHPLVVSRRAYLETLIPQRIKTLEKGKIYTGIVTGTTKFGVFVQFEEYLTGMIHISNLREDMRENILDIQSGTEIVFYQKDIIEQRDGKFKIMLSQYDNVSLIDSLSTGDVMTGTVIQIHHYGALVAFDEDTKGLIPTAEMERKKHPLTENQSIKVMIQEIERKQRKMTLSIV